MKVGDIVKQNERLITFPGHSPMRHSTRLGIVLEIGAKNRNWPEKYKKWNEWLGRSVTVLWECGRVNEIAENSLDIVSEVIYE